MDVLRYIGLTDDELARYCQADAKWGQKIAPVAKAYFEGTYGHISETYDVLREMTASEEELCTVMLILVVQAAALRAETLEGHEQAVFLQSLVDISCKIRECMAYKKAFGIFVLNWYDGLIKNWRLQLGRLQYEVGIYDGPDIQVGAFVLQKGDKKLQCHIPSGLGPLTRQACMESFRLAWEEFPEYRKDGFLPVMCSSWLFYGPYEKVFSGTNVEQFRDLWHYYDETRQETFSDCWRVFSMDLPDDPGKLPQNTRMQKAFAAYMENGGTFGYAGGILLFDGEKIIN